MTTGAEVHKKNPAKAKPWHVFKCSKSVAYIHPAIIQPAKPPSENIPMVHLAQEVNCAQ